MARGKKVKRLTIGKPKGMNTPKVPPLPKRVTGNTPQQTLRTINK